jgi:hypothetical protein
MGFPWASKDATSVHLNIFALCEKAIADRQGGKHAAHAYEKRAGNARSLDRAFAKITERKKK